MRAKKVWSEVKPQPVFRPGLNFVRARDEDQRAEDSYSAEMETTTNGMLPRFWDRIKGEWRLTNNTLL